jgi:HK97 family phage major capsid protein
MTEAMKRLLLSADEKNKKAQELLAKGEGLTADDIVSIETLNSEIATIKGQINAVKTLGSNSDELTNLVNTPVSRLPVSGAKLVGMTKTGESQVENGVVDHGDIRGMMSEKQFNAISTREYTEAFDQYIRDAKALTSTQYKALTEGSDTAGGFLVPTETMAKLLVKEPAPHTLAGSVSVLNCSRDSLNIPKVNYAAGGAAAAANNNYTSGMRVTWTGEQPAAATTARVTAPVFGQVNIPIYTCMMSLLLTNDFIEDAAIDIQGWIRDKFTETANLLDEDMICNGTGANQPLGLIPSVYTTTAEHEIYGKIKHFVIGASDVITTLVEGMPYQLPEQYHGNAKWAFQLASAGLQISKVKDTDGRTLFGGGLYDMNQGPAQRSLLGFPIISSSLMGTCGGTADTYNVFFGDFKGYSLVRRVGFSVQVLNETYAETNAKCLLGRYRIGGAPTEEWRLVSGKVPT